GQRPRRDKLGSLKVLGCSFSAAIVFHDVEAKLLAFHERAHTCALHSGNVNEHVVPAAILLDKAKTFGGIEELDCSSAHDDFLSNRQNKTVVRRMADAVQHESDKENRRSAEAQKQSS